jgi:hypothetical protein
VEGYELLGPLGRGGMGEVYRARHLALDREVALKVIRPHLLADPDAVERFRREARAAGRLRHPNIVTVYDAGSVAGLHFLAMEYVAGTNLARLLAAQGPLPARLAADYAAQVARGLQYAHEQGLVHRDIKPSNLLADDQGVVRIGDFGLARLTEAAETGSLTATGDLVGTPDYLAPEQASDPRRVDIRSDIYGLGCTLYHLLTGRPPFPAKGHAAKLAGHLFGKPEPLTALAPAVPPGLASVVARMMAKDPQARYQTPAEAAAALAPFAAADPPAPPARRRPWVLAGVAAGLLIAAAVAIVLFRIPAEDPPDEGPAARRPRAPGNPGKQGSAAVPSPRKKPPPAKSPRKEPAEASPAPWPPGPGVELVLDQVFTPGRAVLLLSDDPQLKRYFKDRKYVIELPASSRFTGGGNGFGPPLTDFACELRYRIQAATLEVVFREVNDERSRTKVLFRIAPDGTWTLRRQFWEDEGMSSRLVREEDLAGKRQPDGPRIPTGEWGVLRLTGAGEEIELSYNGTRLHRGRDPYRPAPGSRRDRCALHVNLVRDPLRQGADGIARLELERLRLWQLQSPAPRPQGKP